MKDASSLAKKLKAHSPLPQTSITFIAQFVTALLRSRSTNLYRVAEEFQTKADNEFSYRRIYQSPLKLLRCWLRSLTPITSEGDRCALISQKKN
ncbi:MAG: hypothetical protein QS721_13785 [Candidatus Endonucleobacter sp. (ex Gigantidas childressi)]|nr:hypothetical protein [Candidatus Endonucleobacter sp. (ex Gigantidas childressi)]